MPSDASEFWLSTVPENPVNPLEVSIEKMGYESSEEPTPGQSAMLERKKALGIENPNSSGQGFHASHADNPHHETILNHGYKYSHTTGINRMDGSTYLHHSYAHPEHKDQVVGVHGENGTWNVHTLGSGHQYEGKKTSDLNAFLKGRLSRLKKKGK